VSADHALLKEIRIADIKVSQRHRRDMGDLTTLAESIRQEGLLQPIGVTDRLQLVFGERRIRAVRDILRRKTILARIVDVSSILAGEYHENEVRKDFTPSERVAIAKAVERQVGNRRGQRTDRRLVQFVAQVEPGRKTRDAAAERAGFGNHETYRQAAKVVENGTPRLIQAMDGGRVSVSAAALLADAAPEEQERILDLDVKAILRAAQEIRRRRVDGITGQSESYTDDWLTPKYILDALGKFDLDPCAPLDQPWATARNHLTVKDDGLKKAWAGRVWLNPPYGEQAAVWLEKMAQHRNGIALVYARTETQMFFDHVWAKANGILFLKGRLSFCRPDGTTAPGAVAPSVLVSYDPRSTRRNYDSLKRCKLAGQFLTIR
jgi:ParB family chromosome partitioning protein